MCRATPPSIYVLPFFSVDGFVASAVLSHLAALKLGVDVGVGLVTLCGFVVGWSRWVVVWLCVVLYVYSFVSVWVSSMSVGCTVLAGTKPRAGAR